MLNAKSIYQSFYSVLDAISGVTLIKTDVDTVETYPAIQLILGPDTRQEHTKQAFEFELVLYVDIFVTNIIKTLDEQMLDIREQVQSAVTSAGNLGLDYVFEVEFISQGEPQYN